MGTQSFPPFFSAMTEQELQQAIVRIIRKYLGNSPTIKIFLFGSRATGQHTLRSDYDIGIDAETPLSLLHRKGRNTPRNPTTCLSPSRHPHQATSSSLYTHGERSVTSANRLTGDVPSGMLVQAWCHVTYRREWRVDVLEP